MKYLLTYPIRIAFALLVTGIQFASFIGHFIWSPFNLPDGLNPLHPDFWSYFDETRFGEGVDYKSVWHWCFKID